MLASLHWGGNWGFGIEVYRGEPIFYGCGDFLNDYEGIGGHAQCCGDLALMSFPTLAAGRLVDTLNREGRRFGTRVARLGGNALRLVWAATS